jgi:Protein of unknown function (DUF3738)
VDMAGIKGNYDASFEILLAEIMATTRYAGAGMPMGRRAAGNVPAASDPGEGGSSVTNAVQSMGLKLESRKAGMQFADSAPSPADHDRSGTTCGASGSRAARAARPSDSPIILLSSSVKRLATATQNSVSANPPQTSAA